MKEFDLELKDLVFVELDDMDPETDGLRVGCCDVGEDLELTFEVVLDKFDGEDVITLDIGLDAELLL